GSLVRTFTPFHFLVEPTDVLSVRGASVIMNCSAYCETSPKIEWKKDGTFLNLVSDDRRQLLPDGSLLINSVVHSKHNKPDEGYYQCVATVESLGTIVSRTAKLTVAGLPRFASQPESSSVYKGNSAILNCEVNGDLAPFVRWEQDRQPVFLDDRVWKLPSGALIISNATDTDGGLYRCIIESGGTPKYSDEAELKILPDPEVPQKLRFAKQPASLTRVTGQSAVFPCVPVGFPTPSVRWTRNEEELLTEGSERLVLLPGGSLQIGDIAAEDAGTYTCLAESGNDTSEAQAELSVQVPPEFLKRPANIYAHESMDIVFECEVTGKPTPTVKWVKNGDMVIPSDYFKIVKEHNLQVLGLVKSDEGFYQCIAENDVGNAQAGAQLIILDLDVAIPTLPPTSLTSATNDHLAPAAAGPLPSAPRDVVATLVSTRFIRLTWRTPVSDPQGDNLTYSIFYTKEGINRERVENTSRPGETQVTIQNLMPETVYVFRVVAQNKHGPGESSAPLKVATQPEVQLPGPAPNIRAHAGSPTSVTVSWETPLSGNGEIQNYKLYYMEKGQDTEQDVDVGGLSYTVTGLKKYTEYSFRVVAYNKHGPGVSTQDVVVRTLSDVPSAPPQNLTLEVRNSKSIMLHWQPPPAGTHSGHITGYKIRYRKVSRKSDVTESIGGTQLFQLIEGLERGTEYSFRVAALTVNGTGPATDWVSAETFESDLDAETRVPEVPSSLHVRPLVTSIVVSWTPPENQNIVVRGYAIGYGIGSPHAQTIKVDYKQRYYTIENLDPSSHYVITLKAFNNVGEGIPLYESAVTRPHSGNARRGFSLLHGPKLGCADIEVLVCGFFFNRLALLLINPQNCPEVPDALFFFQTANATTLSYLVTGLKPNTLYEFSVMVTKGRRSSTWSMTAHGTTFELVPTSPPKDVTVVSKEGKPRTIIVNWQPPSEANGKITGYIIYYSTDVNAEIHDWVIEPVVGNRLTHQIQELTLDTPYYFKIQARNSKGMGPMSEAVQFRTPKAESSDKMPNDQASGSAGKGGRPLDMGSDYKPPLGGTNSPHGSPTSPLDSNMLLVIIVSVGVITIVIVVIVAVFCTRRTTSHQKKKRAACKSVNGSHKYKGNSKDVKPPDLWIHHERLELKPIDKSPDPNPIMTDTPIPRNSQDITPVDNSMDSNIHQRRNSYRGHESEDSMSTLAGRRGMRPKMMMPFDSQPPQPVISAHPIHSLDNPHHHFHSGSLASPTRSYLHHQLSPWPLGTSISHSDRANSTESVRNTPSTDTMPASSSQPGAEHQDPEGSAGPYLAAAPEEDVAQSLPTAHVRPSHPLKSFAVPAVPPAGAAYDPALPSTPLLTQQAPNHPVHSVKTASIGTLGRTRPPMPVVVPSAPDVQETTRMLEDSESNYEPDELTKEMAHLEGLMKDLNAITTA
ncbi:NEO1 protein, partial [Columbina picui]|nr:NEO1 protein [Columbina picui]